MSTNELSGDHGPHGRVGHSPVGYSHHDVVVVGARAAGAAVALHLARLGHDVVVLDRAELPSDTLSTHCIARSGVVQLNRWGLLDEIVASGAPPIRRVTFHSGGGTVTRRVKERSGVDCLLAPRRHVLDSALIGAAARDGAQVQFGVSVNDVVRDGTGRVAGVAATDALGRPWEYGASVVVGADGLRSRVARSVGAPLVDVRPATGATHYAYYSGGDWDGVEYFVGNRCFTGIFPTHGGEACIWVCQPTGDAEAVRRETASPDAAFDVMLDRYAPELAARLGSARRESRARGMVRMPNHIRRASGPGWALVGDAAYHRDAITGHGISDAFRDAEILARTLDGVLKGDLDEVVALRSYHRRRVGAASAIFDLTCELAAYPAVARFVELQKALSSAIDVEAATLAGWPLPSRSRLVAA
jgi:2-polyprenyl-6-methoxyphenol hydroxylase-like FAD-dependent oxidoreductase